jgi:hypothetical protein
MNMQKDFMAKLVFLLILGGLSLSADLEFVGKGFKISDERISCKMRRKHIWHGYYYCTFSTLSYFPCLFRFALGELIKAIFGNR